MFWDRRINVIGFRATDFYLLEQNNVVYHQSVGRRGSDGVDLGHAFGRPPRRQIKHRLQRSGLVRSRTLRSIQYAFVSAL